jgi:hypothetical protein
MRLIEVFGSSISEPTKMAIITGTIGNTHGETKDTNPAPKAAKKEIFSISLSPIPLYQSYLKTKHYVIFVNKNTGIADLINFIS